MVLTEGFVSFFCKLKHLLIGHCFEESFANTRALWKKLTSVFYNILESIQELVLLYANYSGHFKQHNASNIMLIISKINYSFILNN